MFNYSELRVSAHILLMTFFRVCNYCLFFCEICYSNQTRTDKRIQLDDVKELFSRWKTDKTQIDGIDYLFGVKNLKIV